MKRFMIIKGKAHKFGDNISTDLIAPGRYFYLRNKLEELAKHTLEDADIQFVKKVKKGDIIVAGKNFGLGSSREHAPAIIKLCGIKAVLAKSFARIFYRNSINLGLLLIECDTSFIVQGDLVLIDIKKNLIKDLTNKKKIKFPSLPKFILDIVNQGGVVEYLKKFKEFKF